MATLVLAGAASWSQTTTAAVAKPAAPPPSAFQEWVKQTKNPTDWLTWGADLRLRNEYYNNAMTLSKSVPLNEQDYFRFRARIWTTVTPVTNVAINGRLAAEPREWMKPSSAGAYRGQSGMEWRYGIADNLYVKMTNVFNEPIALSVGRQDILLGDFYDWWLVADGTPGDGSWTFFLDSARLTYDVQEIKTKFDLMYISQVAQPGGRIPTIGDSSAYALTEQDETGVILYASTKAVENMTVDGYFIWKGDDQVLANGDNADIYTLGAKITGTPAEHWQYSVEGAYQFGHKQDPTVVYPINVGTQDRDISAYGGKVKASYLVKDKLNNQVSLVGEFLSGDDPDTTGKDEMFDILWGRWPRWSELYIYSYIYETGGRGSQLNNLGRVGPSWSFNPFKGTTVSAMYNALFALQDTPTRRIGPSATLFSYDGNFRGHYLQAILKHQFNKHVSGHLWSEFVWEGNYYNQRDLMTFLRAEVLLTF